MQDRGSKGFGWLLTALFCGVMEVGSQNPIVKLIAAGGAIGATAKAGECFQDTAKHAYYQLKQASEYRRLQ